MPHRASKGAPSTVAEVLRSAEAPSRIPSAQLGLAVSACSEGVALCDAEGDFVYLNDAHCKMYGYSSDAELLGRSWRVLYDPEEVLVFEQERIPELLLKGVWRGRAKGRRRDGSDFDALVALRRFEDGRILCICSDMTFVRGVADELARTRRQEEATLAAKTRFFSMANHELRTPLATIGVGVEMLALHGEKMTATRRNQISRDILLRVEAVRSILDKFMVIGSQFSGLLAFNPSACELYQELQNWRDFAWCEESERPTGELQLNNRLTPGEQRLADRTLVGHILRNLVENACKYGGPEPQILIDASTEGEELILVVSDRGPGIAPSDQKNVFEPFFRAAATRDRSGSGLGLYLVKLCVESHAGSITLRSEPGSGCTFTVRLRAPVADKTNSSGAPSAPPP